MKQRLVFFLAVSAIGWASSGGGRADSLAFTLPEPVAISYEGTDTVAVNSVVAPAIDQVTSVAITIAHHWLGDLTVKVLPPVGPEFILFREVGELPDGSSAILGAFVPSSDPESSTYTLIPQRYEFAESGANLASEAQLAVDSGPWHIIDTNQVYAADTWASGPFPSGVWQVVVYDMRLWSDGLVGGVEMAYARGTDQVELTWSNPPDIVYGTALGAAQLNAAASISGLAVAGQFTYNPPAGTMLQAGQGQVLSVTFTPSGAGLLPVTKTVTLNVSPAPLQAKADDQTKLYGAVLPDLTATYTGFVNGDSVAVLTVPATLTTTATPSSPVGSYPIQISGGQSPNYAVTPVNGALSVTRAPLQLTADAKNKVYGASLPALTATYLGFVNGDMATSLSAPATLSTTATITSPAAIYPITVQGAASPNYEITFVPGTLTVRKAVLNVTAESQSKIYGAPLPVFTAAYAGFSNGDTSAALSEPVVLSTTATAESPAGSYPITVSGGGSSNYEFTFQPGTLTVTKAALTVTAENKSRSYGTANPELTASFVGFLNSDTAAALTQPVTLATSALVTSPVGNYPITLSGGASSNYSLTLKSGILAITKAPLTVTADNKTKVYGAALPFLTATYDGFVNGDGPSVLSQPVILSTTALPTSPVGAYPITLVGGASANYTTVLSNGTLSVTKATLLVTAENKTKSYGAALPVFTASYSGFLNGDSVSKLTLPVTFTTTATAASPVGTYPITPTGGASANYSLSLQEGALTVTKAVLQISAEPKTKVYGAALPSLTAAYSGFVNGDNTSALTQPVTLATSALVTSPVGNYPITLSGGASSNYSLTLKSGILAITKAPLTVTADNKTKVYGAALPFLTATYDGFVNGDGPSVLSQPVILSTTALPTSPVGAYPITLVGGASANYTTVLSNGTLSVTKATLLVTAENKTKSYGAALPVFTASYSGFLNGDSVSKLTLPVTFTTTATAASPVGTYPITPTGGASANYSLSLQEGALTVTKAVLQISAEPKTKVYGAALPSLTAAYSGFVNGDNTSALTQPVSLSTTATAGSHVGVYQITLSGGASPNYTLSLVNGSLTVTKAPLVVTPDGKSKVYGAPLPVLTASYAGFVNGDSAASFTQPVMLTTTVTQFSAAGTYPIQASGGASPNYAPSFRPGSLVVTKAVLIVTPDNKTKVYGAVLPTLTASYSGLMNGDTLATLSQPVTLSSDATTRSPVGLYSIRATGGASANYTIEPKTGTLAVTTAALKVTAEDKIKVYGAALPALTAAYAGFVNGDTSASLTEPVTFTTTANTSSPVGSYTIVGGGGVCPNYTLNYQSGTLVVSRALLTVNANDLSKVYGAPLPAFSASYSGFVNGDTVSALTQPVSFVTTATAGSPVGVYQIRVSGGSSPNYNLALNNATLSITKAPLTIRADDKSMVVGNPLPTLTASYTGWVNGDTIAVLNSPVRLSTAASASSPAGSYVITASGTQAANYEITVLNGTLVIAPSQQTPPSFNARDEYIAADGAFRMTLAVASGTRVRLESSEDLKEWQEVETRTATNGELIFSDRAASQSHRRFFRAVVLP